MIAMAGDQTKKAQNLSQDSRQGPGPMQSAVEGTIEIRGEVKKVWGTAM